MTLYESASLIASALGTLVLVITLIFVARQTSQMAKQFIGSPHDRVAAQMLAMNQVFIDHPEMRPYFYEARPIYETDADYQLALAIAEMRLDFLDTVVKQDQLFRREWHLDRWRPHILWSLRQSPILRRHLEMMRFTYSDILLQCLAEANTGPTASK